MTDHLSTSPNIATQTSMIGPDPIKRAAFSRFQFSGAVEMRSNYYLADACKSVDRIMPARLAQSRAAGDQTGLTEIKVARSGFVLPVAVRK